MAIGDFFQKGIPKIIGGPYQPPVQPTQPQAQVGLPLIIQQLYGGAQFTPGADTMEAGFKTSPGFRPGSPMNINLPPASKARPPEGFTNPGFVDVMPKIPGVPFGAQTTLADLSAFNPIANQYALAGFTVGEILAMPEFAEYGQTTGTGGTATSAGLANLEAQLRETGSKGPEDRIEGFRPQDNPLSFSNPLNQTSMKFVDGKLVYDKVNPFVKTGIKPGDEVPGLPSFLSAIGAFGTSIFDKVTNPFTKYREEQKAKKEAEIAAEIAAANAASVKEVQMAKARQARIDASTKASRQKAFDDAKKALEDRVANYNATNKTTKMTPTGDVYSVGPVKQTKDKSKDRDVGRKASKGDRDTASKGKTGGGFCFDPDTLVKMYDGTEKKIKDIKLGDQTKGGEVTGVFQFKASDEIHDYKGVTVAGSHYVKEDGNFIMVQDSPIAVKIDKIPVVHSLDTTGRRIFIKDIEFADYNGDGIAKGFLANAGVDLTGFDKEVLRQVENRLI